MKRLILFLLLSLACGCVSSPKRPPDAIPHEQRFTLRYKFSANDEWGYTLRSGFVSNALTEPSKSVSLEHEIEFHLDVREVFPNGGARVAVVIDRLRLVLSRPDQELAVFDSGEEADEPCPKELRGIAFLVGKEMVFEQTVRGENAGVQGLADLYRQATRELLPGERFPLERFLRDIARKPGMLLGLDVRLPGGAVRPDEVWSADAGPFPILFEQLTYPCDYILQKVSDNQAVVRFEGSTGAGANSGEKGTNLRQVRKVGIRGVLSFDIERGIVTEMRGEWSSYLRVRDGERLRKTCSWALTLRNRGCLKETKPEDYGPSEQKMGE